MELIHYEGTVKVLGPCSLIPFLKMLGIKRSSLFSWNEEKGL